ncbi:putative transcription factor interactor and regulator CCHC(Zn) family [Helianthus annuus]|nr:putative transcription factor interactor and regulator CCHC(Zn) family [Helianthus annuus]
MLKESEPRVERRTCFKCQEVGHIAWNCSKPTNTKQGVSSNSEMKEKYVDKKEQPTEKFKEFKDSTFEVGESSKHFYKRRANLNKHKWVVKKSEVSSGNESDSSKSEEPSVVLNDENFVPTMDDENFPPLSNGNLK